MNLDALLEELTALYLFRFWRAAFEWFLTEVLTQLSIFDVRLYLRRQSGCVSRLGHTGNYQQHYESFHEG